jgi:hypothetical protein
MLIPDRSPDGTIISRNPAFADKEGFRVRSQGMSGIAAAGAVTDIVFTVPEDRHLNGVQLILKNHHEDDVIDFLVAIPNGTIVENFGTGWTVDGTKSDQGQIVHPYKAFLPAGFKIVLRYHSVGSENVKVKCNLFLHKQDIAT